MRDPYEILGIHRTATLDEIKAAYKKLAKEFHPDKHQDNPLKYLAEEQMREINEAYQYLTGKSQNFNYKKSYTHKSSTSTNNKANTGNNTNTNSNSKSKESHKSSSSYDKDGYDKSGYDRAGYNKAGYDKTGFDRSGQDKDGYNKTGFRDGYNRAGYDSDGYNRKGYDSLGFDRSGYDKDGYDKRGYNKKGYDRADFDIDGYDRNGYNRSGYDKSGFNKNGYNREGYNRDGYNWSGFDRDGYDKEGFGHNGINRQGESIEDVAKRIKKKRLQMIIIAGMCAATIFAGVNIKPILDYKIAVGLLDAEKYQKAITKFEAMGDYKDSKVKAQEALKTAFSITDVHVRGFGIGDTIKFGTFGNRVIEWEVLLVEENRALLVSKDCVSQLAYNQEYKRVTWEQCSVRQWLNNYFYNRLESHQKNLIIESEIENEDNEESRGGNNTKDKIFLLSLEDVKTYFKDNESRKTYYHGISANWWLRSPGYGSRDNYASIVDMNGIFNNSGFPVSYGLVGVRPALWLSLV
ncbi:MAG: DUF6273 domain-containing protein [Clostridiales Family XIII bacterium]|jgi:curved DNA-binding protein CbpA|nr:DUF6273 domain-containing protein [Clostridiales Family XIII bacterium]